MADDKVVGLRGALVPERKVNETCVELLEELLAQALSGEIVGVAAVSLHFNSGTSWSVAGTVGGYGMVGACERVKLELMDVADGSD